MYRDHRAWRAGGADHGGHGRGGPGAETPGGRCSGRRSARNGSGFSGGGGRNSGNWRDGARGVGQSFTGVKSDSGSSWRKTAMECWGASGLGGSSVANCERSVGRSRDARKCWGAFGRSWSIGNAGSGFRWGKRIRKRCGRSKARRGESTAAGWKGQRNGRVRRRGGTDSQCITIIVAKTGTGSSARRRRSGMEQVREIDGEQAYEKMRRAMEKADREKARQVERARQAERSSKLPASQKAGAPWTGPGLWPQPLVAGRREPGSHLYQRAVSWPPTPCSAVPWPKLSRRLA